MERNNVIIPIYYIIILYWQLLTLKKLRHYRHENFIRTRVNKRRENGSFFFFVSFVFDTRKYFSNLTSNLVDTWPEKVFPRPRREREIKRVCAIFYESKSEYTYIIMSSRYLETCRCRWPFCNISPVIFSY